MKYFVQEFVCDRCQKTFPVEKPVNLCPNCGGLLETRYDTEAMRKSLSPRDYDSRGNSIWRWKEFLPVRDEQRIVTLGEGGTPLVKSVHASNLLGLNRLYFKNDTLMPTGSFKDRGFSLAVSFAREIGVKKGITYSSGNAGASLAAYSSRAGLNTVVLVEYVANPLKRAMIGVYGSQTVVLKYESMCQITEMLEAGVKELGLYQFVNFINPVRHEGMKTCAYEICQQLDWHAPDVMVHPVGTGGGLWGAYKGFQELVEMGWIEKIPRMVAVQPQATSHIVKAFDAGKKTAERFGDPSRTIAQSIAADAPIQGGERVLRAIYQSKGFAVDVSDEEIVDAIRALAMEGIAAEPASATSLAAVKKAVARGLLKSSETVVCVITGSLLKQPAAVELAAPKIELEINANIHELAALVHKLWQ
jgi:threonine synthase